MKRPRLTVSKNTRKTARGLLAVALICVGVGLWSIPAALIVGGVLLLADLLTE